MPEGVFLFIFQPVGRAEKQEDKEDEKTIMLNIVGVMSCYDNAADNGTGGGR